MKRVPLSRNKGFALVDDEDFERVNKHSWSLVKSGKKQNVYYAKTTLYDTKTKNECGISLHRFILNLKSSDGKMVDHINSNGLDNRKKNLRCVTASQNTIHARKRVSPCSSKYKGVCYCQTRRRPAKWRTSIKVGNKSIHGGYFRSEKEAAVRYNELACQYYKEYARLNAV